MQTLTRDALTLFWKTNKAMTLFFFATFVFLGIGVIGLLLVFIAVGDELDATGLFARRIVTRHNVPAAERAGYRTDLRAALEPALVMKLAGAGLMIVGYGGFFWHA